MRRKLLRTPAARRDLLAIWSYIARDSERAADRLLDRFETVLMMLLDNPFAGRPRTELRPNLRSIPSGTYVLFYEVEPDALLLVRVLHGRMDITETDFA